MFKLGWARVNFNYFISDEELKFICDAIRQIGKHGWKLLPFYKLDPPGLFIHKDNLSGREDASHGIVSLTDLNLTLPLKKHPSSPKEEILNPNNQAQRASNDFHSVLEDADVIYRSAEKHLRKVIISQSDENFKRSPLADSFIESLPPDVDMNTIWWSTSEDVVNHYAISTSGYNIVHWVFVVEFNKMAQINGFIEVKKQDININGVFK